MKPKKGMIIETTYHEGTSKCSAKYLMESLGWHKDNHAPLRLFPTQRKINYHDEVLEFNDALYIKVLKFSILWSDIDSIQGRCFKISLTGEVQ